MNRMYVKWTLCVMFVLLYLLLLLPLARMSMCSLWYHCCWESIAVCQLKALFVCHVTYVIIIQKQLPVCSYYYRAIIIIIIMRRCVIVQVSYTPSLRGISRSTASYSSSTPSYYQLFPSDSNIIPALVSVLKAYHWRQMTIISEKEDLFLQVRFWVKN